MIRVLLDVDGVLADFVGSVLPIASKLLGRDVSRYEITSYSLEESLGMTPEQVRAMCCEIDLASSWCRNLAPCPGAIEGYAELASIADVYIVTSPWNSRPTWTYEREAWLRHYFGITPRQVIHTSAKHLVRGDVLIDDKTSTLEAWSNEHCGLPIQWATPHNRRDLWTGVCTSSWGDLVGIVSRHGA